MQNCQNTIFASIEDTKLVGQPNSELKLFGSHILYLQSEQSKILFQNNAPHKISWRQRKKQCQLQEG